MVLSENSSPTDIERRERYEQFVNAGIPESELRLIRDALNRSQLTGGARFVDEIEQITGARHEMRGQGRPKKARLIK